MLIIYQAHAIIQENEMRPVLNVILVTVGKGGQHSLCRPVKLICFYMYLISIKLCNCFSGNWAWMRSFLFLYFKTRKNAEIHYSILYMPHL